MTVHIQLDDNHAVESDVYSWQLCKRLMDKNGDVYWKPYAWYGTLQTTLKGYIEGCMRSSDARSIPELMQDIDRSMERLERALRITGYSIKVDAR